MDKILRRKIYKWTREYTQRCFEVYGDSPQGLDYRNQERQDISVSAAISVLKEFKDFSVGETGCGTGRLLYMLRNDNIKYRSYTGYDIVPSLVRLCKKKYVSVPHVNFRLIESTDDIKKKFDFIVGGGIFNLKKDLSNKQWEDYVKTELERINRIARRGFIVNMLTSYSEKHKMKKHLYYASPLKYFDYCKKNFSPKVRLLHDYYPWEFTIFVSKE